MSDAERLVELLESKLRPVESALSEAWWETNTHASPEAAARRERLELERRELLGNPDAFFRDLGNWGLAICGQAIFPDHHRYTQRDIVEVRRVGKQAGANAFVTTEKDAQNLHDPKFEEVPIYIAVIDLAVTPEADFRNVLDQTLAAGAGAAV